MKRPLLKTPAFEQDLKRVARRNARLAEAIFTVLDRLGEDAGDPRLKTHKLKGALADRWSCSAGYDLRIIDTYVPHGAGEAILLLAIGSHDRVY